MDNLEERYLLVTADDFGIGPATTRGILELASRGIVTASVLLVNSPYAEESVAAWHEAQMPMELGWHPCLTLDRPILPPQQVPSLVDADGKFLPLGKMMRRLLFGGVQTSEVEAEFRAQHQRFQELTGQEPTVVNCHHHLQVFSLVGSALRAVLEQQNTKPYLRCIREPWRKIWSIHGARPKRAFLNWLGRRQARCQIDSGFPGNDWLLGITDPLHVSDPEFFTNWLRSCPGKLVELTCHPGQMDLTLSGRDGSLEDGQLARRARELELLNHPGFQGVVRAAGFTLVSPAQVIEFWESPAPVAV